MNRVPANEVLKQYVQKMLEVALQCLLTDNEDNALVCLRLIFELHKNFRPGTSMEVSVSLCASLWVPLCLNVLPFSPPTSHSPHLSATPGHSWSLSQSFTNHCEW